MLTASKCIEIFNKRSFLISFYDYEFFLHKPLYLLIDILELIFKHFYFETIFHMTTIGASGYHLVNRS